MNKTAENILGGILVVFLVVFVIAAFGGLIAGACIAQPHYKVWTSGKSGEAELRKAEHNRKVAVEEAKARKESAGLDAEAEVIRAYGVAEANQIIGDSLKNNEGYLRYLWIQGLHDGSSEIIYIPTEANLPILEATRGSSLAAK